MASSTPALIVGDKGVIAVDAQASPPSAQAELAAIARVTAKPVDTVILTHSDSDHINGLPGFARGMRIIAQETAGAEMHDILTDPHPRGGPLPAGLGDYLPNQLVRHEQTMTLDGVRMVFFHFASGHTDGDLVTYLPAQKIVFAGDLITEGDPGIPQGGLYPVIHLNKRGTSAGWIAAIKGILALDADRFVGGHGHAIRDRATLVATLKAVETRRAEVKRLFDDGKSLAEIKVALGETGPALRFPTFTDTTYEELLHE